MGTSTDTASVDWRSVDTELAKVPDEFKDPKFYALKHVVEILTSNNPQAMVSQLRDQEQRLASLVDNMVQGYHSGFAKSIQNYSQILQLFGDSKEQVDGLKKALADASRQLSAQSRTLQQQWRRSLTLEASLKLLDDIQLAADAPAQIDKALAAKAWSKAVGLLLDACNKLARDEVTKVGAVRRLRQDLLKTGAALQEQMLDELQARVYSSSSSSSAVSQQQQQWRQQQQLYQQQQSISVVFDGRKSRHKNLARPSPGNLARMSPLPKSPRAAAAAAARDAGTPSIMPAFVADALMADSSNSSSSRMRIAGSSSSGGGGGVTSSSGSANVVELVHCLVQLDALSDAKAHLLLNARSGIRRMIMQVVAAWAAAQEEHWQQQQRQQVGTSSRLPWYGNAGSSSSKQSGKATSAGAQLAAQKLLQAVFDSCIRALMNLGLLLQELAAAQVTAAGSSAATATADPAATAAQEAAATRKFGSAATAGLHLLKQEVAAAASGSSSSSPSAAAAAGDHMIRSASFAGINVISRQGLSSSASVADPKPLGVITGFGSHGNLQGLGLSDISGTQQGLSSQQGSEWLRATGVLNPRDVAEYVRIQYGQVWHVIQEECLLLLGELLRSPLRSAAAAAAAASTKQGGWLSEFAELGERAKSQLLLATGSGGGSSSSTAAAAAAGSSMAAAAVTNPQAVPGSSGSFTAGGPPSLSPTNTVINSYQGSRLTFTFDLTATELLQAAADMSAGVTAGPGSSSASRTADGGVTGGPGWLSKESQNYAGLLRRGLGEMASSAYLTPLVYPAVTNFVSDALIVISEAASSVILSQAAAAAAAGGEPPLAAASSSSLRPTTPPPTTPSLSSRSYTPSPLGKPSLVRKSSSSIQGLTQQQQQQQGLINQITSDASLTSVWLKQSIEDYVMEVFLPQVWVDLRGRCTAALEDPEAFRPQLTTNVTVTSVRSHTSSNFSLYTAASGVFGSSGSSVQGYLAAAGSSSSSGVVLNAPPKCVVAAAVFACQVLSEVIPWMGQVPLTAAPTLAGVLDSILSYVLKALAWQAATTLSGFKAGKLALNPNLSLTMATEPDAILLSPEEASAFYVPRTAAAGSSASAAAAAAGGSSGGVSGMGGNAEGGGLGFAVWAQNGDFDVDKFIKALKSEDKPPLVPGMHRPQLKLRGLGLEGDSAAAEVLLYCFTRQRPAAADQLLSAARPAGLVQLVSLGESCEWVANNLAKMAAAAATGTWFSRNNSGETAAAAAAGRSSSPNKAGRAGGPVKGRHGSPKQTAAAAAAGSSDDAAAAVSTVLQQLADRYLSLSGACLRAVRLDLLLLAAHQLHSLAAASHICDEDDVLEAHPCIGSLIRQVSRAAEEVSPHLNQRKLNYVFGAVAGAAAHYLIWVLQDIPEINANGVERIVRSLALLQGQLTGLGVLPAAAGGTAAAAAAPAAAAVPSGGSAEVTRAYDRAKSYYTLVGLPADEVISLAADRPGRFSVAEWEALLQVRVPGRACEEKHFAALHKALDKYYHITTGQKVAEFFEGVGRSVQEPVQKLSTGVTAGLKGSFVQAKAFINKAAAATATSVGVAAAAARDRATGTGSDKEA